MSRASPSYHAAPAAIYLNGRFVDGAVDGPAIGCHFLFPHGSGAIHSRSNAIAASHTACAQGHHFQALRAFLCFAIPEHCTPTPWRRKRTMLHPYTTKCKEMRGTPRSLGGNASRDSITLYSDCSSGAWLPLVPPQRHVTGPRTTVMATDMECLTVRCRMAEERARDQQCQCEEAQWWHRQQWQQALCDKRHRQEHTWRVCKILHV
ncbi:hypothetical protein BJV78DRAFT_1322987 [Lactifluus subvellereus]|nr:hypothetical protein BJV78DRAFT_1322987 [Lactifluus subvellereus]